MNVFLGRCDQGVFSVAFTAGSGINLFEYLSETNEWQPRGYADCADVLRGEPFSFSVDVNKDEVRVSVNGKRVIEGEAETIPLGGPWGLSAQNHSAGLWKLGEAPGFKR